MMSHSLAMLNYPANLPLTFISCGRLVKNQDFIHQRRTIDSHVLIFVTRGTLYITQDNTRYSVSANQFIILRAFTEHYGYQRSSGELRYFWVHFYLPECLTDSETDLCSLPDYGQLPTANRVALLFNQLLDCSKSQTTRSIWLLHHMLSALALEISGELFTASSLSPQKLPDHIEAIQNWISRHYQEDLTVSQIAELFHYNPDYLSSDFKKHTGISLIQFINRTRIEIAKNLLVTDSASIKELAAYCGFKDEKYFSRVFKQQTHMTPRTYKNTFYQKKTVYQ